MFNRKVTVKESTLDKMRAEAMKDEDYSTVRKLNDIESEIRAKLVKERIRGIFDGYGSAMAGLGIGAFIINQIKTRKNGP